MAYELNENFYHTNISHYTVNEIELANYSDSAWLYEAINKKVDK